MTASALSIDTTSPQARVVGHVDLAPEPEHSKTGTTGSHGNDFLMDQAANP